MPRGPSSPVSAQALYIRSWAKKDLGITEFPAIENLLNGRGILAFRQHSGGHTDGPNWPVFLKFADRYIKTNSASSR